MRNYLPTCPCGSGKGAEAVYDGHGIFMCYTCTKCRKRKLKGFRSDIFEQYQTDEPIEAD